MKSIINKILPSCFCIIAVVLLLGFITGRSWAREEAKDKDRPPVITSDTIEMRDKGNVIAFKGNVKMVKGNSTVTADKMINFVKEDRIDGEGNVHFVGVGEQKETVEIKSDFVQYFNKEKKAILTGKPWAYQDTKDNKGEYTGDKMTIFTEEQKLVIEGNAKAIVYPKENPEKDKAKTKEK
ncbi:MAG: LptA/OstA family protein [bacterium]